MRVQIMAKDLKNKTVVVTGGASGIGLEIADKFLHKGAKFIIILDINEKRGQESVKTLNSKHGDGKSVFIKCDVTSDLEIVSKKIIDDNQYVDVLVNSAGVADSVKITIDINVTALIVWSMTFWNHMRKDLGGNGGTIMNLSSVYGFRVTPFVPVYHASKFAVMGFTRSLGHEYNFRKTGVRVVSMNPGFTKTSFKGTCDFLKNADKTFQDWTKVLIEASWQEVSVVGNAAVDIFESADSGTAWVIEESKPIEEIKP